MEPASHTTTLHSMRLTTFVDDDSEARRLSSSSSSGPSSSYYGMTLWVFVGLGGLILVVGAAIGYYRYRSGHRDASGGATNDDDDDDDDASSSKVAPHRASGEVALNPVSLDDIDLTASLESLEPHRFDARDMRDLSLLRKLVLSRVTEIWLATYRNERVAVKMLQKNLFSREMHLVPFVDAIERLVVLNSPHIVTVLGCAWTRPPTLMCVMELMDGGALAGVLAHSSPTKLAWSDKYAHVRSIVEGLFYLDSVGVVHGNLTSHHVLLDETKHAKLIGIVGGDSASMARRSVAWTAPEVLAGQSPTSAADIYSFGVLLTELDTHRLPYADAIVDGHALDDANLSLQIVTGMLSLPLTDTCPAWVADVATKCLNHVVHERPSAKDLRDAIVANLVNVTEE
ncbi:Aste57867_23037 [Aphanomyces stellatus]|uniref:Aste57867_23037 protein n=1 Tax=Aphanomyces stellatus TaxID=120398 RepID=A0A485LLU1_9STRA|nr:hypothetical protein As57867_022966 [Aphanomyces stellatus]VFT99685.1 Aste57867_23037 [Aphanomyces stellatus]